ncbi:unnamed protein product [Durusdinium trenchii]|uniref:Uncharacterized protein n=2 Tax=Durusdinium trenchii TaxID=1381693 RepID=A0ABP0HLV1_9DINO
MSEAVDVRKMHWYGHYRHTVFNMVQSCFEDDGASGVVLIGIQPTLENVMTCAEWPCIMQDLQAAFEEKKAPFYQKGQRKLDFTKINFKRISIQDLGEELEVSTRRSKQAIIASCAEDHFEAAVAAMRAHNTSTPDGCGKVRRAWATAEDVYGGRNHPPKAAGYAPEADVMERMQREMKEKEQALKEAQEALRAAQASEPASPAERQAVKSLGLEDLTASADSSMYSSRGRVFVKRLEQSLH